jgi:hypothetical protein
MMPTARDDYGSFQIVTDPPIAPELIPFIGRFSVGMPRP